MTTNHRGQQVAQVVRALAQFVLRFKMVVIIATAVVTGAAAWSSGRVRFDSSADIWFLDDDPELETYRRFKTAFSTDELLIVAIFADDVFTDQMLGDIAKLTGDLAGQPDVHAARSLTTAQQFVSTLDSVELRPVYVVGTATVTRARALADPLIADLLVSHQGTAAAIVVELDTSVDTFEEKVALIQRIRKVSSEIAPRVDIRFGGTPAINEAIFRYSRRDFQTLGLLSLLLILGIGVVAFRRFTLAVVPLTIVVISVIWLFGVMGLLGWQINLVSQSLVTVILAVGIADAIHVLSEYRVRLNEHDKLEAIVGTVENVAVPCLFTTLTTVGGMVSLSSSHLAPIREFGLLAALGVAIALVVTFTTLPALLAVLPAPPPAPPSKGVGRMLAAIIDVAEKRRFAIVAIFVVATGLAGWRLSKIHVGANPVAYFKVDDPVRRDIRRIDDELGGSTSIELLVETKPDGLANAKTLRRLEELESWLATKPAVTQVLSITDALSAVNAAMTGRYEVPSDDAAIAQSYLLIEDAPEFNAMLNDERDIGRVSARVKMSDAAALVGEIEGIEKRLASEFNDEDLRVRPTGFVKLIGQMEIYIVDSQVRSFLLALVVVSLLMILLLRSLSVGLIAMLPNLAPVAGGLAIMELCQIRLDPGTAMIGSITLGLVVDDTVHLLSRVQSERRKGRTLREAVPIAVHSVGRALITTSVVLALGFGVLSFGSFTPNIYLGVVASAVIMLALIADLLVVPALAFALDAKG